MKRGGNLLVLGLLCAALLTGVFLTLTSGGGTGVPASVLSESARGRSLIFETLAELGFESRTWNSAPGSLPDGGSLLWMHDVPETPAGYGPMRETTDAQTGEPAVEPGPVIPPDARRRRDPMHYLRFVGGGGVLLLPGREAVFEFLTDTLGLEELSELERVPHEGEPPLAVVLPDGETFEVAWEPEFVFTPPTPTSPFEVVLADEAGRPLALEYRYGLGSLVLLSAEDDFVDNARIDETGNALLAVRLLERQAPGRGRGGEIWFDEYALGGWRPDSPLELAFAPANLPFSSHLVLFALVSLWGAAWVRAFPRDPVQWTPVSALMRAQGFAGLLVRARRFDLLAALLRHGVLRRLAPRRNVHGEPTPRSDSPSAEAVRETLAPLLAGASGVQEDVSEARALELLVTRPVPDREALERLGHELRRLEIALGTTPRKPPIESRGRRSE